MSKKKEQLNEVVIQSVEELDVEVEQLSLEILQTREELAVITEVRDELVKLYSDYKELEKLNKSSKKENGNLKVEIEKLSSDLYDYKIAEEKVIAEKKLQKLEQLSAKFKALGQQKTVEQLSEKDGETLDEFEKIVDAALDKVEDVTEMPSVTRSSQEEEPKSEKVSDVEKPSNEAQKENPKEQLSDNKFFANICSTLTSEQAGSVNKRVKLF